MYSQAPCTSRYMPLRRSFFRHCVWRCGPRSHGRRKAATPLTGRTSSSAVPPHRSASASSALCPFGHAQRLFRPLGLGAYLCRWLVVFRPGEGSLCPWLAGPRASLRAGGTGACVQGRSRRPQTGPGLCKASAGAAWGVGCLWLLRCYDGSLGGLGCGCIVECDWWGG